jgi:sugar transferase (PEP-CTERM system associated)
MDGSRVHEGRALATQGGPGSAIVTVRFFNAHVHRLVLLGLFEIATVFLAVELATLLGDPAAGSASAPAGPFRMQDVLAAAVMLVALASMGLYQLRYRSGLSGILARLLIATFVTISALALASERVPSLFANADVLGFTAMFSLAGLAFVRYLFARMVDDDAFKLRVVVWGAGRRAASIASLRRRADQRGFKNLGFIRAPGDELRVAPSEVVKCEGDLLSFVLANRVDEVVEAMDDRRQGFPNAFLRACRLRGIAVRNIVEFLERESGSVAVELAHPSWFIHSPGFRSDLYRLAMKRAFDVTVATVVLVLALPIALLTALAIVLDDGWPILYSQVRTGQHGKPFRMLKFRSMSANAEADGRAVWAQRNDPRYTRVGALLRKLRIDELPQVWNVLVGHMSFVGPRPERPAFVERLSRSIPFYEERHYVKPGITGWAQVRYPYGASESDAREKLGYDLYYIAHQSLAFDLMVLLQTVEIVLLGSGAR